LFEENLVISDRFRLYVGIVAEIGIKQEKIFGVQQDNRILD
jgi:hypothetical protein